MKNEINEESLNKLIESARNDKEILEMISDLLRGC